MKTPLVKTWFFRFANLIAFGAMIAINYFADSLPLWAKTTSEISEIYAGLFVPAGYAFAIWWAIYFLLGGFIFFQFYDLFLHRHEKSIAVFIERKSPLFILSCVFNIAWIYAWHYEYIGLSLVFMTGLFMMLSYIYGWLLSYTSIQHPRRFTLFFLMPFRIYFSWVSIAIFLNISAYLTQIGIGQGIDAQIILSLVLLVAILLIQSYVIRYFGDKIFGLVGVWTLTAVIIKLLVSNPSETRGIIFACVLGFGLITYLLGSSQKKPA